MVVVAAEGGHVALRAVLMRLVPPGAVARLALPAVLTRLIVPVLTGVTVVPATTTMASSTAVTMVVALREAAKASIPDAPELLVVVVVVVVHAMEDAK